MFLCILWARKITPNKTEKGTRAQRAGTDLESFATQPELPDKEKLLMLVFLRNMRGIVLAGLMLFPVLARAERLPIKAYTVADGLPNNVINKIVRDSRGFLWFCTGEGLSRFDGYSFTNYGVDQGLPHAIVNDFLETRNGELWIASNGGRVLFNPKGEPAARIIYASDKAQSTPMFSVVVPESEDRQDRAVNVVYEDRSGTIWCGTMKHLYRLERHD